MGLSGSSFFSLWGGGGGSDVCIMGSTRTRRVSPFLQEDRDLVPSTWARFLSSHDRSNAKKDFWFPAAKEPLQRSDYIYISPGSPTSARLPKQVINLTTGFDCFAIRGTNEQTNERMIPLFPAWISLRRIPSPPPPQASPHTHTGGSSLLWYTHLRILVHFQIPFRSFFDWRTITIC